MKRFLFVIISFLIFSYSSIAAHIIGGEMRYVYVGPGASPNSKIYKIILLLFKGDATGPNVAPLAPSYVIGIFNNDNNQKIIGPAVNGNWTIMMEDPPAILSVPIIFPSCIQNAPVLNYTYATYSITVELPDTQNGYTCTFQSCCRINGMINVGNSTGSTYSCGIPGVGQLGNGTDNSPEFGVPVNVICNNAPFTLSFNARDTDAGDSLVYSFCDAFDGGLATGGTFDDPASPPYGFAPYSAPYSGSDPFGTGAIINPQTGVISGIAPDFGKYVVSVCINVYRNGLLIARHKKDLIVQVSDCVVTVANPMPDFTTCDGFTLQFSHTSTGANAVFWDFGVASLTNDTSNIDNPTFTFPDTGIFRVKFVINRGTSCSDSVIRNIGVFPGFFPGFVFTGSCFTNPYQFTDTTSTQYGVVNSWSWNFGDLATLTDTSHNQNPQWTYPNSGTRDVSLIVTNSKGCIDTALVTVNVLNKPLITMAFTDTLICVPDAVTLGAAGTGIFNWTPLTNIIGANSTTPTVNPTANTWYVVHLNSNGCINDDSVHVRVVNGVSLTAMPDTVICLTDPVQLNANTDGLTFQWTPAATLNNPNILNPIATPVATSTTYQVRATIGSCFSTDAVIITTVPYPIANAGPDQVICYNSSAQLNGSHDGNSFTWSPVSYLDNPNILNPVSSPPRTTSYILTVLDNAGCPKPGRDTIVVTMLPRVRAYAGRDTVVVVGQPLQFNGTGGINYLWSPATGLSSTIIANPIGVYSSSVDTVKYKLIVTDVAGCADSAFITVRVFKTNPYIFVPTAFTPNNDGKNDVIRPIAIGIEKINYFSIYNRWGQLVFTTTADRVGWDGRIAGRLQDSGVYVWMVSAIDYTGRSIFLKGTVTLIR